MSDPLTDLINDVQHNGVRWVTVVTVYAMYRKERRNHLLNKRDQANFDNQREVMKALGVGDKWKDGPKFGFKPTDLPNLRRFFLLSRKDTILRRKKIMEKLKSRKFWMAILAVIIPVINTQFGINLDTPTIISVVAAIVGYIASQAHVDATIAKNTTTAATSDVNASTNVQSDPNKFLQG
ncbi:MAG: hypothetical protein JWM44_3101 [Bacilli bacterium]|nr:hypothetical protein [Bacilli bacterium]